MNGAWYHRPPLEEMTKADWSQAKKEMNPSAFRRISNIAQKGKITTTDEPFLAYLETESETSQFARSRDLQAVEEFNRRVIEWGGKVRAQLKSSARAMVKTDRELSKSIRVSYRLKRGELSAIGFSFAREGAWIYHGAQQTESQSSFSSCS